MENLSVGQQFTIISYLIMILPFLFIIIVGLIFLIKYISMPKGKHSEIIKNNPRLTKCKKSSIYLLILFFILISIAIIFHFAVLISIIPLFLIRKYNNDYKLIYKNEIIHEVIKKYDSSITYNQHYGIDEHDYLNGKFEWYDKYYAEDLITKKTSNYSYEFSDVTTKRIYEINDSKQQSIIFQGSVAVVNLPKSVDANILILNNQLKFRTPISYIHIDNAEFEKKFDVHTDDPIMTMRILTPYVTDKIMEFTEKTNIKMQFKIFDNKAYFRFHSKNLFEPSMFLTKLENKNIDNYIEILKYIDELMVLIIKEIDNLEV